MTSGLYIIVMTQNNGQFWVYKGLKYSLFNCVGFTAA